MDRFIGSRYVSFGGILQELPAIFKTENRVVI